jgi:hypothetical protein
MSADDALLFIDANQYIDLYRIDSGEKLLAALSQQADHIFATQQVVNEVQRNKLTAAVAYWQQQAAKLKVTTSGVPDHLAGANEDRGKDLLRQMSEIDKHMKLVVNQLDAMALSIIGQISRSGDNVSRALAPIFAKAVRHSKREAKSARRRRELGNPPGKKSDPLGDQLTWEQILSRFRGKKRLWIISGDGDYGTKYSGKRFLNPFLLDELHRVADAPEVFLFDNIPDGIRHFAQLTDVQADKLPTREEAEQIKKEAEALLPLGWMGGNSTEAAAASMRAWYEQSRAAYHAAQLGTLPDMLGTPQPIVSSTSVAPAGVPPGYPPKPTGI